MLNFYNSIKEPEIAGKIQIQDWLNQIQSSKYSDSILAARIGILDYSITKAQLPAVTWNFNFIGYKKDSNCIYSTGYVFIDIDNEDFNIDSIDKSKIYSYYKSFGGKGYGIICKVLGITFENFKTSYLSICMDLGILNFIDRNAVKASQYSVLSFDPNLFINSNSHVFDFSLSPEELNDSILAYRKEILELNFKKANLSDVSENDNNFVPISIVSKEKKTYTIEMGTKSNTIKYNSLSDVKLENPYLVNWDGIEEIKCTIPMKKLKDGRKRSLVAYTANYLYLNQNLPFENVLATISKVNKLMCLIPLPQKIVYGIVNSIFQQKIENRLKPITSIRKIVFSKDSGYNKEDKLAICRKVLAEKTVKNSKEKIYLFIEEWDFGLNKKITVRKLAEVSKMNFKTIAKYYPEFKDLIQSLNNEHKIR
ncbi:hypothetical protein [Pedobacter agri]|uniref:hypothetical protein n=1 Tax=Pedobacter agri TaxID=454586 RepID=UPI00292D64EE|nr:hypothetical protein [Pedobacter agri]